MSQSFYPNQKLTQHDADVLSSRAIAPDVARARGTRSITASEAPAHGFRGQHALDGLLIPLHNTQGEVDRWQLRPHHPPLDAKGNPRKYLWATGTRLQVDVPPASQPVVRSVNIPVVITESALKADALQSAIEPGTVCVMAPPGVYGWRSEGMPLSDFQDIPWRTKDHDRITFRRPVCVAFDSDTTTNPSVARARWELTEFLRRKGARVRWIDVPAAADGGKQGVDDALAGGHTFSSLFASAYPAPDIMPTLEDPTPADDADVPEIEQLRTEVVHLRRLVSAQAALLRNPVLKDKPRMVGFATITTAASMAARGKVEPDGRVRLSASQIANDYRPKPAKGEALAETNPQDGTIPLTSRDNAKSALKRLIEQGVIDAEFTPTKRQHKTGDWYGDSDILVRIADTPTALLQLASYDTRKPRNPYTRQAPCKHCGEVHARTVQTIHTAKCHGCGVISTTEDPIRIVPIPPAQAPNATEEQRERLRAHEGSPRSSVESASGKNLEARPKPDRDSPSSMSSSNYVSRKNLEAPPPEPTGPPLNWEDERRRVYGQVYRGEAAS